MKALAWYNRILSEKPLVTKSVSSFFIFGLGDSISQYIEQKGKSQEFSLEKRRCLNLSVFGAVYLSPILHHWYGFLARRFPKPGALSVLKKLSLDQTLFANFAITSFFVLVTRINGGTFQQGIDKVKNEQWNALLMNWRVWPMVMAVNFSVVPVKFHVISVNLVAILWNAYLSYITNFKSAHG